MTMPETIQLPRALRARLRKAAVRTQASPEVLVRRAVKAHLDYLDWREKAIREGFESGKTGGWRSTEDVFAAVAAQRAKRASKKAA
jgi:predicted transcriptional regulator